jgi:CHRD domain
VLWSQIMVRQQPLDSKNHRLLRANLKGSNEVPPVDTAATGTGQLQVSPDGKDMSYDLSTVNLNGFMMTHIHQGKTGENGQPITIHYQQAKERLHLLTFKVL